MEVVRRIVLVAGVVTVLWLFLVPTASRVAIGNQDFRADQARRPAWSSDRKLSLPAFTRKRAEGRMIRVSGEAWSRVADAVDALEHGKAISGVAPGPIGEFYGGKAFYLAPDAPVLGEVGSLLGEGRPLLYVRLGDEDAPRWLTATWCPGSDGGAVEPASIFHPYRHLSPWVLLATLAFYVLLPRPKRAPDTLRSDPRRAVVLPDVIGTFLLVLFFGLSLGIASDMAATGQPLDAGWRVPTLILWGMSLFSLPLFTIAAHYATLRFRLLPDRVERVALGGTTGCPYAAIESVEAGTKEAPKALGCLGLIVGLLDVRALGATLLATSRGTEVLTIRCADGGRWQVSLSALEEPERLVAALRAKGPVRAPGAPGPDRK